MNITDFYHYVIQRDVLGFVFPGGIVLADIIIIIQAFNNQFLNRFLSFFATTKVTETVNGTEIVTVYDNNLWILVAVGLAISFLIGHILDLFYRWFFQSKNWYQNPEEVKRELLGYDARVPKDQKNDPIAKEIRQALSGFFGELIDEAKIKEWEKSKKLFKIASTLGYWSQRQDEKLFNTEIARPIIHAHLLHSSAMAFILLSGSMLILQLLIWMFPNYVTSYINIPDSITLIIISAILGVLLLIQGRHKRENVIQHQLRVFYTIWKSLQFNRASIK